MRIAVIGDSILWGQGLLPNEKCTALVAAELRKQHPKVEIVSFARSGADVWDDREGDIGSIVNLIPGPLPTMAALPGDTERAKADACPDPAERAELGEIPSERPFTIRQVDKAREELSGAPPDVVIVDAGINDVNVPHIVVPYTARHALRARTQSTASSIQCLLGHIRDSFPSALIIVTGYYKIVTQYSNPAKLLRYAWHMIEHAPEEALHRFNITAFHKQIRFGAALVQREEELLETVVGGQSLAEAFVLEPKSRMVELSTIFADTMHGVLRTAAAKVGARVAIPTIPEEHAAFTDDPWLWGLADDLRAEDSVAEVRRQIVAKLPGSPLEKFIWDRASLGHPNVKGAEAYATAILKAISA